MKLDIKTFNSLVDAPHYEGVDAYLIDDDKNQIPYHIYMCLIESESLAAIFTKKIPTENENYIIYEFNGNKLLEHKSERLKELKRTTDKYKRLVKQFENKEFQFQDEQK